MSRAYPKQASPRHGIVFNHVPTSQTFIYHNHDYGWILDCVYEMADAISTSNGITVQQAISQVLKDEQWKVLPRHQKQIVKALEDIILYVENGAYPIILEQSKSGKFRVRYGLQVTSDMKYAAAAKEFGECYFHMLACDGKLNNEGE